MAKIQESMIPESDLKVRIAVWSAVTGGKKKQLAKTLGISKSFLSQIISGHRPGKEYVDRITEITKIA